MKTLLFFSLFFILSGLPLTGNWTADADKAKITFTVDGPFGDVHGSFSGLKSEFQFDEKDLRKVPLLRVSMQAQSAAALASGIHIYAMKNSGSILRKIHGFILNRQKLKRRLQDFLLRAHLH
jgi:hypothetical protein